MIIYRFHLFLNELDSLPKPELFSFSRHHFYLLRNLSTFCPWMFLCSSSFVFFPLQSFNSYYRSVLFCSFQLFQTITISCYSMSVFAPYINNKIFIHKDPLVESHLFYYATCFYQNHLAFCFFNLVILVLVFFLLIICYHLSWNC